MFIGLGLSDRGALRFTALYHTVAPIATIMFMLFIVDTIGRRKPMLYATPFLAMLFIVFAVLSSNNPDGRNKPASSAGIVLMFLFNFVFCMSWGPLSWTYMGEVIVRPSLSLSLPLPLWFAGLFSALTPRSRRCEAATYQGQGRRTLDRHRKLDHERPRLTDLPAGNAGDHVEVLHRLRRVQ